jgi:hypothetical protein
VVVSLFCCIPNGWPNTFRIHKAGSQKTAVSEPVGIGIDVAKASFEVAFAGEVQTLNLGNDEAGQAELCWTLLPIAPRWVVLQATGGY